MNLPSYDYDPRFVHADLREKHAAAARERLARQARRTAHAPPHGIPCAVVWDGSSSRWARPCADPCQRSSVRGHMA
jgi:hypothetical protein